jgi:predicted O-methyltransferase YrrM
MKHAADAIVRSEQASYLEAVHALGSRSFAGAAQPGVERDPLVAKMEARAADRRYPISDPEVAALIANVARIAQPRTIVELGTNIGYGAIVLARAAGPQARVITVEYRQELCEEARGFIAEAGLTERIEVRHGMAIPELEKVNSSIDLVYIDCVKEEYPRYLELALPKLSARGIVLADNVLWKGLVASAVVPENERERVEALRAFNMSIVSDTRLSGVILPIGDGVAFAVRRD